jgi:hypothetical protein
MAKTSITRAASSIRYSHVISEEPYNHATMTGHENAASFETAIVTYDYLS